MAFDLSLPIYAVSGLTLLAVLTYFGLPKIQIRTYNKIHGGLRVLEMAVALSRSAGVRQSATAPAATSTTEFVIYITLKSGNL